MRITLPPARASLLANRVTCWAIQSAPADESQIGFVHQIVSSDEEENLPPPWHFQGTFNGWEVNNGEGVGFLCPPLETVGSAVLLRSLVISEPRPISDFHDLEEGVTVTSVVLWPGRVSIVAHTNHSGESGGEVEDYDLAAWQAGRWAWQFAHQTPL